MLSFKIQLNTQILTFTIFLTIIYIGLTTYLEYNYPIQDFENMNLFQWGYEIFTFIYSIYSSIILHFILKDLYGNATFKLYFILNAVFAFIMLFSAFFGEEFIQDIVMFLFLVSIIIVNVKFILIYKIWYMFLIYGILGLLGIILQVWLSMVNKNLSTIWLDHIEDLVLIFIFMEAKSILANGDTWKIDLNES